MGGEEQRGRFIKRGEEGVEREGDQDRKRLPRNKNNYFSNASYRLKII